LALLSQRRPRRPRARRIDALAIALYVEIDDFLGPRRGPGRPPRLSDAELITLAVCQVFLGLPNDRQFLALARYRLGHLFPTLIDQSGYNRRLRALAPQIARAINLEFPRFGGQGRFRRVVVLLDDDGE
jgi:hypothetical protein